MAMGRKARQRRQEAIWIAQTDLPRTVAHTFYEQLNRLLEERSFDEWVEQQCTRFYAERMGRPSLAPGRYFRLLLIGYFEGIDSERGIAWRAADSLALRSFLGAGLNEMPPDRNDTLQALGEAVVRTYISEPDRGQRHWQNKPEARQAVYDNRRRIRGEHGKQLLRRRGELVERSFAHAYETGGMRRAHLRGRDNVLKRMLIHVGGFNLSLVMRKLLGKGTPRGLQGLSAEDLLLLLRFWVAVLAGAAEESASTPMF